MRQGGHQKNHSIRPDARMSANYTTKFLTNVVGVDGFLCTVQCLNAHIERKESRILQSSPKAELFLLRLKLPLENFQSLNKA